MGLYFDRIFKEPEKKVPGKIKMVIPVIDNNSVSSTNVLLTGISISEPSLRGSNEWGPIMSDTSNLTDLASFLGSNALFSWIGASALCWKGTDPLKFNVDFYVLNYDPGLNVEVGLEALMKLVSLTRTADSSSFKVRIHGGYTPDVLANNANIFDNSIIIQEDYFEPIDMEEAGRARFNRYTGGTIKGINTYPGTVRIEIGEKIAVSNLLVSSAEIVPSLVEVCDSDGNNVKPLYYRVSVALVGEYPILSTDVDTWISG